ncbi:MAG: IS4 family transposase [Planctomycetaceae bacterium]|nr:IS4 family transposase [Planctomycetaceae bacterium]
MSLVLDVAEWAEEQFGSCDLGDVRRTRRAVKVATHMAAHPDGTTPRQLEEWSDLKAAYRLFDQEDVTFTALAEPHWRRTRAQATGVCLVINDTTETDFGIHRHVEGLGPTGDGGGRGFLLHSALLVQADTREVIGLAGQELFYRQPIGRAKESSYRRTQRARESEVWGRVIDLVGPPPDSVKYLHVDDRGADNIEVFCHLRQQRCGWVIRASQLTRIVQTPDERRVKLQDWLAEQQVLGTYALTVRATKNAPPRTARLQVRTAPITLISPRRKTPYLRQIGPQEISGWVVEAREADPPKGATPVRWVLHTSEPVAAFDEAWRILEYYETRWLIEEFHKCLKTGCRLETRMYATAPRLEAVAGLLSVLAVRLLQLKQIAQQHPDLPAEHAAPDAWLSMLRKLRRRPIVTVRDFVRQLAGLGGFLLRKGDGEPGWMTIWHGLDKLLLCLRGADAARQKCG